VAPVINLLGRYTKFASLIISILRLNLLNCIAKIVVFLNYVFKKMKYGFIQKN